MTVSINTTLKASFTVAKCEDSKFDGEHTIEFDLSNLTQDDLEQYILQTLVIKYQGMLRSKTATGKLENQTTYVVPAPGKRISADPIGKAAKMITSLTEAQKKELAEAMGFTYVPKGLATPDPELEAGE